MKKLISVFLLSVIVLLVAFSAQKADTTKNLRIAAIPVVNYNNSFGFTLGAMAMGFYHLNFRDTISPPSSTGLFLGGTTNKSVFSMIFQKFYFAEDQYRATLAGGFVSVNFQTFVDIPISTGAYLDYNTEARFVYLDFQRVTFPNLFIGAKVAFVYSTTSFDTLSTLNKSQNMNNFGLVLSYDTRDNVNNPSCGIFSNFSPAFYRPGFGAEYNYNSFELNYNHLFKLKEGITLLGRFKTTIATGDVPFEGQSIVGRDDIRGYTNGRYRGNQVYALQTELRWNFYKEWGMVGFLGVASAVDQVNQISIDALLPGAGAGIRYMMIKEQKINVGIDVAIGKEDWGLYFRIGEAFGR